MNTDKWDIMTVSEVADYLRLAERTVLRLAHRNEIPCFKIASQWRFKKDLIDEWIMMKIQDMPSADLTQLVSLDKDTMLLTKLITRNAFIIEVRPGTKVEVLEQLVKPLAEAGIVYDAGGFQKKLMHREKMVTTAVGHGVAFPHLRKARENPPGGPYLVLGTCPEGTDFGALDGEKTHLFALICADNEILHLRLMARLALLLRADGSINAIVEAGSKDDIREIFEDYEGHPYSEE